MKLILTNDDGIDAPGIRALQDAVQGKGIIVAPQKPHSGCGHQVTTHSPLQLATRSPSEYALDGTPADCTRIALTQIAKDTDWILSGINAGGNLGVDMYISGTVAAVREAAILGVRGIAFSHWIKKPLEVDWELASYWSAKVLDDLLQRPIPVGTFLECEFTPFASQSRARNSFCEPSIQPLSVQYHVDGDTYYYNGEYAKRPRVPGSDVDVCFSGNIAVTKLSL